MPSPLPGMDPYLEHPRSWPNFHHRLITAIAISLGPRLRPKYRVVVAALFVAPLTSPGNPRLGDVSNERSPLQ